LAFYAILIPGDDRPLAYDAITGVAIILIGLALGVYGSTINPLRTVIAAPMRRISPSLMGCDAAPG